MKKAFIFLFLVLIIWACSRDYPMDPEPHHNPEISLAIPVGFPALNASLSKNAPTQYGVALGEKLFHEKKLSGNNTISCASCHNPSMAFADHEIQAVGIHGRVGLRNTPPIQNLAFMDFYNWDGNKLSLESQALVPILAHEEMDSSMADILQMLKSEKPYVELFAKAFGDDQITADRVYESLAQFQYTLISANSKYDRVQRDEGEVFTESEVRGHYVFQQKCAGCHSTELFTDQRFRNVGFPVNPSTEEAGRARVTGLTEDLYRFRVPSLRNAEYTAPYGSFGQFPTLRSVLDYFDNGVIYAENLDPILKENGNRIPLSEQEKVDLIDFIKTLSDTTFLARGFPNPSH